MPDNILKHTLKGAFVAGLLTAAPVPAQAQEEAQSSSPARNRILIVNGSACRDGYPVAIVNELRRSGDSFLTVGFGKFANTEEFLTHIEKLSEDEPEEPMPPQIIIDLIITDAEQARRSEYRCAVLLI